MPPPLEDNHLAIVVVAPVVENFRTEDNSQTEIVVVVAAVVPIVEVRRVLLQAWKHPQSLQLPARPLLPLKTLKVQTEANLFVVVVVIEGVLEAAILILQALSAAVVLLVAVVVVAVVDS